PVIDQDADDDHGRDQEEAHREGLEEPEGSARVPGDGQEEDIVDDLAGAVGDAKSLLDDDLRPPINGDDNGGHRRQQDATPAPASPSSFRSSLISVSRVRPPPSP